MYSSNTSKKLLINRRNHRSWWLMGFIFKPKLRFNVSFTSLAALGRGVSKHIYWYVRLPWEGWPIMKSCVMDLFLDSGRRRWRRHAFRSWRCQRRTDGTQTTTKWCRLGMVHLSNGLSRMKEKKKKLGDMWQDNFIPNNVIHQPSISHAPVP
jgi:hypothetical protein